MGTTVTLCGHGSARPSTKDMEKYCRDRFTQIARNGKNKGLVSVRRLKELNTEALRQKFHDLYKTILGRNIYSQTNRQCVYKTHTDGKYYSDCSSSGCGTFREMGINIPLYNTAWIYQSDDFEDVPVVIKAGQITNPEVLRVGDALLFVGEDPSRPKQIGHVEWVYEITQTNTVKPGISNIKKVSPRDVYVTSDGLNVRDKAGTGTVLSVLGRNDKVTIVKTCVYTKETGAKHVWGYSKQLKGWISLDFTSPTKDSTL